MANVDSITHSLRLLPGTIPTETVRLPSGKTSRVSPYNRRKQATSHDCHFLRLIQRWIRARARKKKRLAKSAINPLPSWRRLIHIRRLPRFSKLIALILMDSIELANLATPPTCTRLITRAQLARISKLHEEARLF